MTDQPLYTAKGFDRSAIMKRAHRLVAETVEPIVRFSAEFWAALNRIVRQVWAAARRERDMFAGVRSDLAASRTSLNAEIDVRAAKRAKEAELLAETARRRAARRNYMPPAVTLAPLSAAEMAAPAAPAFAAVANECERPSRFNWLDFAQSEDERRCRARGR